MLLKIIEKRPSWGGREFRDPLATLTPPPEAPGKRLFPLAMLCQVNISSHRYFLFFFLNLRSFLIVLPSLCRVNLTSFAIVLARPLRSPGDQNKDALATLAAPPGDAGNRLFSCVGYAYENPFKMLLKIIEKRPFLGGALVPRCPRNFKPPLPWRPGIVCFHWRC